MTFAIVGTAVPAAIFHVLMVQVPSEEILYHTRLAATG